MCKKRAVDAREAKVPKVYEAQARAIDALFDVTPGESGSMWGAAVKQHPGSVANPYKAQWRSARGPVY